MLKARGKVFSFGINLNGNQRYLKCFKILCRYAIYICLFVPFFLYLSVGNVFHEFFLILTRKLLMKKMLNSAETSPNLAVCDWWEGW